MILHLWAIWFVGALALATLGCGKKSAADLEKDWNAAVENTQKYAAKYPAVKPVLDDLTAKAKVDFEDAKKAPEDGRADKMNVAVDRLTSPIATFASYETEVTKLDTLLQDKDLMNMSAADFKPLETAGIAAKKKACCILQPTQKACSDLQGTCDSSPPVANIGELKAKLEAAITDLRDASKALEQKKPKPAAPPSGSAAGSAKK